MKYLMISVFFVFIVVSVSHSSQCPDYKRFFKEYKNFGDYVESFYVYMSLLAGTCFEEVQQNNDYVYKLAEEELKKNRENSCAYLASGFAMGFSSTEGIKNPKEGIGRMSDYFLYMNNCTEIKARTVDKYKEVMLEWMKHHKMDDYLLMHKK